jgi:hypothetical protein
MPVTEISDSTEHRLDELRSVTGRSNADLIEGAINRSHRALIGHEPWEDGPTISTGPFRKVASHRWAEAVLRQVDPKNFHLVEGFRYCQEDETRFIVPRGNVTDLASIPPLLMWLVPPYGRHTLPALLHDHLQDGQVTSEEADDIFREAMVGTKVPLVRRWLMWAAVKLWTRLKGKSGRPVFCATVLYAGAYLLVGLSLWPYLGFHLLRGSLALEVVLLVAGCALVSPALLCVLWGRGWRFGFFTGTALLLIAFPTALIGVVTLFYVGVELVLKGFQARPDPIFSRNLSGDSTWQGNPTSEDL